ARVCGDAQYLQSHGLDAQKMQNATHLVWATGGGMVPADEMAKYLSAAKV
ncbi:MAG: D-serine dehydratase, partial [Enterobacterales bacterium]|nr:D-serine dehydratase [Enterobacterales bacterium]